MKTSERFTNAVTKLYNAFHNGELDPMDSCACAVGNLCDNSHKWNTGDILSDIPEENIPIEWQLYTGYSAFELRNIESLFMFGSRLINLTDCVPDKFTTTRDKDSQFRGLCAVIEYLCELEGIPNVMDYTSLFETEADQPKHKLEEVFA